MISAKVYRQKREVLLAASDEELLGKTFRDGGLKIEVSSFYDGERVTPPAFLKLLEEATIANLVGTVAVRAAIEAGFVAEEMVLWIGEVPHAQMVRN